MKKRLIASFCVICFMFTSATVIAQCVWDPEEPQNGWCTYNQYDGWSCTAWGPFGEPEDCINGPFSNPNE